MKNTIGKTIAEMMVINVRVSSAVHTDEIELTHASKMFFVSFIVLVLCFSYASQFDLPVEICEHQDRCDHGNDDPNFSRQTGNKTEHSPHRLPDRADNGRPQRFRGVLAARDRRYNVVNTVKFFGC